MEPLTSTVLATLLITKMVEKLGETLGEKVPDLGAKVWEQVGKLKGLVKAKSPETGALLEAAENAPVLVENQPEVFGLPVLSEQVGSLAAAEPDIGELIDALDVAVRPQLPETFQEKVVKQVLLSGIEAENINIEEVDQTANPDATNVEQEMLTNVKAKGNITLGKVTQKS